MVLKQYQLFVHTYNSTQNNTGSKRINTLKRFLNNYLHFLKSSQLHMVKAKKFPCVASLLDVSSQTASMAACVCPVYSLMCFFQPMEQVPLRNSDILIMGSLTQTPMSNPDAMIGEFCVNTGKGYLLLYFTRPLLISPCCFNGMELSQCG